MLSFGRHCVWVIIIVIKLNVHRMHLLSDIYCLKSNQNFICYLPAAVAAVFLMRPAYPGTFCKEMNNTGHNHRKRNF